MKSVEQFGQMRVFLNGFIPLRTGGAEAAAGRTGIVNFVSLLRRALRVDAQTDAFARSFCFGRELLQLSRRIEHDVIRIAQQLVHFVLTVGGAKHMYLAARHFFSAEPRFKQAARFRTDQMRRENRIKIVIAERLLCQKHLAARALLQRAEHLCVMLQDGLVHEVARCGQRFEFRRNFAVDARKRWACIQ